MTNGSKLAHNWKSIWELIGFSLCLDCNYIYIDRWGCLSLLQIHLPYNSKWNHIMQKRKSPEWYNLSVELHDHSLVDWKGA